MSQMPKEVEVRIRALPGNNVCCDCSNVNPQWATVNYGALMCLECSGQHRSLGVHLSFVRSVQMDSWTEKQIAALEKSGGNQTLVDFFKSKGIEKNLRVATKYNSKQAAYYRERLSRRLDGKTEPPPDPGRYDPSTGGSEALGAEPLPGETTDQYNERQARLREDARERLRQKFGGQGMGSVGSSANVAGSQGGGGYPDGAFGSLGGAVGAGLGLVGGFAGGAVGFLKEKVVENDSLHSSIRSSVGGALDLTNSVVGAVKEKITDGDLVGTFARNATFQEGSGASAAVGWTKGAVGSVMEKSSTLDFSDLFGDEGGSGGAAAPPQAPRCSKGHALRTEPRSDIKCTLCNARGTRYSCSAGCDYNICTKCFEKPAAMQAKNGGKKDTFDFDDDSWGNDVPPPKDPTKEDMDRLAKEMGMKLSAGNAPQASKESSSAGRSPSPPVSTSPPAGSPMKLAGGSSKGSEPASSPSPKKQPEKKKGLDSADDFFADFGM